MDIFLRGLTEQYLDKILQDGEMTTVSALLDSIESREVSRDCFLMGYVMGAASSQFRGYSMAIHNRPPTEEELENIQELLLKRLPIVGEKIVEPVVLKKVEKRPPKLKVEHKERPVESDIKEEETTEIPLKTVATIDETKETDGSERFSFKVKTRKKPVDTIFGIPIEAT